MAGPFYFRVLILAVFLVFVFGFAAPFLVSEANTLSVITGFGLMLVVVPFVLFKYGGPVFTVIRDWFRNLS